VQSLTVHTGFKAGPNPAGAYLLLAGIPAGASYIITGMDGRVVGAGLVQNDRVETAGLAAGIYLLRVAIKGKSVQLKFLKQ
jgi:hypothetical protein